MQHFKSLKAAVAHPVVKSAKGPVAVLIAEDDVELASTLRHHLARGFGSVLLFAPPEIEVEEKLEGQIARINFATMERDAHVTIMNAIMSALPEKTWVYYGYNAEYLYYPFSENRSIGEMLAFHTEERRFSMLTYVVDIYAGDLAKHDNAVSVDDALMDCSGYYSLARNTPKEGPKERQLDFYGGLRWRFEEHVSPERRKIDRIALVRSRKDILLRTDHTWSDEELNTYACPWHHNLTAAIVSFRAAKALRNNPASRHAIDSFKWHNSVPFEWSSQQLLDLGLMEPGQWF